MGVLLDTNILVRLANSADPLNASARRAVGELHRRGDLLFITPQNLVEFRSVATRPVTVNGLGLDSSSADTKATAFEQQFQMLPDTPDIHPAWKQIVSGLGVIGKQVHDARLVAVCHAHAVSHLLTFNDGHFARLATIGPGISVLHPDRV